MDDRKRFLLLHYASVSAGVSWLAAMVAVVAIALPSPAVALSRRLDDATATCLQARRVIIPGDSTSRYEYEQIAHLFLGTDTSALAVNPLDGFLNVTLMPQWARDVPMPPDNCSAYAERSTNCISSFLGFFPGKRAPRPLISGSTPRDSAPMWAAGCLWAGPGVVCPGRATWAAQRRDTVRAGGSPTHILTRQNLSRLSAISKRGGGEGLLRIFAQKSAGAPSRGT